MYFYNARYYDPYLNRFLSPDSIIPDPQNPQDLNRYSYARNNPVRYTDPTGHCIFGVDTLVCIAVGGAVVGGLIGYGTQVYGNLQSGMDLGAALTTDISAEPIISGALLGGALAAGGAYVAAALGIGGTGAAAAGGAATVVNGAVQAAGADGDPTNEIQHGMQILERAANNANIRPQFRLGAQAQLDRATHWLSTGRLTNVEQRIANGRLDLALTNGQAVEVKYWTNTYALQSIETLGGQLLRYQNAGYNMILEMLTTKTDPITSETWARIASYLHSMGVQLAEGSGIVP